MHQAEQLCEHIVMINNGRKVLDDSLPVIRARHDPKTIVYEPIGADGVGLVREIEGVRTVTRIEGEYEVSLRDGTDPAGVMRQIVSAVPVTRVELRKPTLEDIFIEIVTRGASSAEAARVRASLHEGEAKVVEAVGGVGDVERVS
jgi:ABC-2 type transport system ATP-binding protein